LVIVKNFKIPSFFFLFLFLFCKKEQRKRKKKEAKKKEKEKEKTLSVLKITIFQTVDKLKTKDNSNKTNK